jgi:hypothetical protein
LPDPLERASMDDEVRRSPVIIAAAIQVHAQGLGQFNWS